MTATPQEAGSVPVAPPDHAGSPIPARTGLVAPSREDAVVHAASAVAGGPAGRRLAGRHRYLAALPVLVLFAVCSMALATVAKQHCRNHGWVTPDQFWHLCYSDIPVLYGSAGLAGPDRTGLVEAVAPGGLGQPPLLGAAMWLVSTVTYSGPGSQGAKAYFEVSAVLLAALLAGSVLLLGRVAGRRPWDLAHLALSPVLLTASLINYDLLAVALCCAALLAWSRRNPALAGIWFGLAIGARPVVATVAVAVLALGLRAGRFAAAALFGGVGMATWLALRVILMPGYWGGLGSAWESWRDSTPGYGSIWLAPSLLQQSNTSVLGLFRPGPLGAAGTTTASLLGLAVVVVATVLLALAPARRPRLAHLALFAVAGTLLVTKSLPVQWSLLLLPFLALSGLKWRDHLLWATTELIYFVGVWLFIAGSSVADRGLPPGIYLTLTVLRLAGIGWIAAQAVRQVVTPELDRVRTPVPDAAVGGPVPAEDDPHGGVLDGAPDALVVRLG